MLYHASHRTALRAPQPHEVSAERFGQFAKLAESEPQEHHSPLAAWGKAKITANQTLSGVTNSDRESTMQEPTPAVCVLVQRKEWKIFVPSRRFKRLKPVAS